MSLVYLPENGRRNWLDQMAVYPTFSPELLTFDNRIEFHDPDGQVYVAKTFGTEVLNGKTVQKGIAARVLEYANELLVTSVVTDPIIKNGVTIGFKPKLDVNGKVQYRNGTTAVDTCENSKFCSKMKNYAAMPKFMVEAQGILGWTRNIGNL
jgi:hypothetical protein